MEKEEEEKLKLIQDEGLDLLSRGATKEELSCFFIESRKKLTNPKLLKAFEDYELTIDELNEILH